MYKYLIIMILVYNRFLKDSEIINKRNNVTIIAL